MPSPQLPSLKSLREQTQAPEEHSSKPLQLMTLTKGGLGNIIFQWLATEAHAKANAFRNPQTSYLSGTTDKRPDITAYEMFRNIATFEKLDIPRNHELYKEPSFLYRTIHTPQAPTQVLDGYFQSWIHSYAYRRQLVSELRSYGGQALDDAQRWLARTRDAHPRKRLVGIHVRQGDYLAPENKDTHYICDGAYWERALRTAIAAGIVKDGATEVIVIASDDPVAVKKMHVFKALPSAGYEILWLPPGDDPATTERTFWILAGLDTLLVSNSSFSLAAWMCRDRETQLVAPARWFCKGGPDFRIKDIVPEDTLLIE